MQTAGYAVRLHVLSATTVPVASDIFELACSFSVVTGSLLGDKLNLYDH